MRKLMYWSIPLTILIGYSVTLSRFSENAMQYSALNAVSLISACFLLYKLKYSKYDNLMFWIILVMLAIGYYFKFYIIASMDEFDFTLHPLFADAFLSNNAMIDAFWVTSLSFCAFCATSFFLIRSNHITKNRLLRLQNPNFAIDYKKLIHGLMLLIPILMISTTILSYKFKIGIMGSESVQLPFRLSGFIYNTRFAIIPSLLLVLIYSCRKIAFKRGEWIGITLMIFHGLSDVLLKASKSALLIAMMQLFLLSLVSSIKFNRTKMIFFLIGILVGVLTFTVAAEYRILGLAQEADVFYVLTKTVGLIRDNFFLVADTFIYASSKIVDRITGVDMLILYCNLHVQPLFMSALDFIYSEGNGVADFVTFNLLGQQSSVINAVAPGLIGWFYLVGGTWMAVLGIPLFVLYNYFILTIIEKTCIYSLVVSKTIFLSNLILASIDGGIEGYITFSLRGMAMYISIFLCEVLFRRMRFPRIGRPSVFPGRNEATGILS